MFIAIIPIAYTKKKTYIYAPAKAETCILCLSISENIASKQHAMELSKYIITKYKLILALQFISFKYVQN